MAEMAMGGLGLSGGGGEGIVGGLQQQIADVLGESGEARAGGRAQQAQFTSFGAAQPPSADVLGDLTPEEEQKLLEALKLLSRRL